MSARTVIVCNRCGVEGRLTPADGTAATRTALRKRGWRYWKPGVDCCSECLPIVVAERRAANPMGYA